MASNKGANKPSPAIGKNKGRKKPAVRKSTTRRTKADKISLTDTICSLYEQGEHTIESCCSEKGVVYRTFMSWVNSFAEIADRLKEAKEKAVKHTKGARRKRAVDGIDRLITGYFIEETEEQLLTDKNGKIISKRITKRNKWIEPKVAAVIFTLKNLDPANWNNDNPGGEEQEEQVFIIGNNEIKF